MERFDTLKYNIIRFYLIQYDLMQYSSLFNVDMLKTQKDISQKTVEFCFYDTCKEKEDKMNNFRTTAIGFNHFCHCSYKVKSV